MVCLKLFTSTLKNAITTRSVGCFCFYLVFDRLSLLIPCWNAITVCKAFSRFSLASCTFSLTICSKKKSYQSFFFERQTHNFQTFIANAVQHCSIVFLYLHFMLKNLNQSIVSFSVSFQAPSLLLLKDPLGLLFVISNAGVPSNIIFVAAPQMNDWNRKLLQLTPHPMITIE